MRGLSQILGLICVDRIFVVCVETREVAATVGEMSWSFCAFLGEEDLEKAGGCL